MMDIGLLALKPAHITGLDVRIREFNVLEHAAKEVSGAGYAVPYDYRGRLSYVTYKGGIFPFSDDSFDMVFSWGAFEHITNPRVALAEARRVVTPSGRIFIVVYPWFHAFHGSHLTAYISEPYFHLRRSNRWVWKRLNEFLDNNPELAEQHLNFWRPEGYSMQSFLREVMWHEYRTLNGYSARRFIKEAAELGLIIEKLETKIEDHPAAQFTRGEAYVDLVSAGTTVLFRPGKGAEVVNYRKGWLNALRSMFSDHGRRKDAQFGKNRPRFP